MSVGTGSQTSVVPSLVLYLEPLTLQSETLLKAQYFTFRDDEGRVGDDESDY